MSEEEEDSPDDSCMRIYPSLGAQKYTPQDLIDFSTRAITKYNQKKGSSYMFVELVEAISLVGDTVVTDFKAQESNGVMKTLRARATTIFRRASGTTTYALSDPNLRIRVILLPYVATNTDTDSESEEYESEEEF